MYLVANDISLRISICSFLSVSFPSIDLSRLLSLSTTNISRIVLKQAEIHCL